MRLFNRIVLVLIALLLMLSGGWTYQRVAENRDDRRYLPPGKLHRVQGRLMHIHCRGQGSPTLIVEQGIGGPSLDWNGINEQMSGITRVCAYDRAGMGYSEPANTPTRSTDVARNLHALLREAEIADDLVLVGWSAGGLYAREYYRQFPERVKGMVLVDSAHEQALQRMPPQPGNEENLERLRRNHRLAQFGWLRLTEEVEHQYAGFPPRENDRQRLIAQFLKSHAYRTLYDEGVGLEQDLARGVAPPRLGDLPLIVIAEGQPRHPYMRENLARWHQLQGELAALSSNGRLVIAENSAHFIHRTEPELIVKAVDDVIGMIRNARRSESPDPGAPVASAGAVLPDYVRYAEDEASARLEVAIKTFEMPSGQTVDLIGVVHIADAAYYQRLNERFDTYDSVLFELVGDPRGLTEARLAQPAHRPDSNVSFIQRAASKNLNLAFQLSAIDYSKQNMVHADASAEEFARMQAERGENVLTLFVGAMQAQMRGQMSGANRAALRELDTFALIRILMSEDSSAAFKKALAKNFDQMESMTAAMEIGPRGSAVLSGRNGVVMGKLKEVLASRRQRRIAVFYGGAHMPGIESALIAELAAKPAGEEWLAAWTMPQ